MCVSHVCCTAAHLLLDTCRGLQPTPLRLKQQVDPLWTVSQNVKLAPATQKLPPASVLASIPVYKEWPETAQVAGCWRGW